MPTKTLTKTEEPWIGSFTPWDDKNPPPSFAREPELMLQPAEEELPTPEAVAAVPQTGPGGGRSYEGFLYEQLLTLSGGGGFQVTLTTPATGDTLIYNSSNSTFENKTPANSGFLPITGGTILGTLGIQCPDAVSPPGNLASLTIITPSATNLSLSVGVVDINVTAGGTMNLATGARSSLRQVNIEGRIYTAGAASVITEATGLFLNCLPIAGSNVTFTDRYALYVNGNSRFESAASGGITYVWKLPTDNTTLSGGITGRIPINIGGALRYVPYYTS